MSISLESVRNTTTSTAGKVAKANPLPESAPSPAKQATQQAPSVDTFTKAASEDKEVQSRAKTTSVVEQADRFAVTKMSEEDRGKLISALKDEQEQIQQSFLKKMAQGTLGEQYRQWSAANSELTRDGNGIWKFIASGNYTVDAETKQAAQEAISENGYYGIKKTSQRLFDFVAGMAGGDPERMKQLQAAVQDGYNEAMKAWGGELPQISKDTLDATNKLFDDYYKSCSGQA